jgi:hypothetical protein
MTSSSQLSSGAMHLRESARFERYFRSPFSCFSNFPILSTLRARAHRRASDQSGR